MTTLYHLSPKTHKYARCSAQKGNCPYGSADHISAAAYAGLESGAVWDRKNNVQDGYLLRNGSSSTPYSVKVAPEGISGMHCPRCGKYLDDASSTSVRDEDEGRCSNCEAKLWMDVCGVDIRSSEQRYLTEEGVREASWFHATTNPNWLNDMADKDEVPFIHVGSRSAALDRLRDIAKWQNDGSEWFLYELKVQPDSPVNTGIFEDENTACPSTVNDATKTEYEADGVNRYLNQYEAPGTISLVGNPDAFYEASCVSIPLDQL